MKLIQSVASLKNLQHNFPKMRGGGSKAVWIFSENSSVLEEVGIPKTLQTEIIARIVRLSNAPK